jgi:hypothetical protein
MAISTNIKQLEKDKFKSTTLGGTEYPGVVVNGVTQISDGTSTADVITVDGHKGLVTISPGHVSTNNSTTDTLNAGIAYTGTFEELTNFGVIVITLKSDVASAADGLQVDFSTDGTVGGIVSCDNFTIPANTGKTFSFQAATKYYRVVYTNGGSNQTSFDLQTVLKPYYVKPSSHRINDAIIGEDDAELVKSVLTGLAPDTTFKNVLVTNAGEMKISVEAFDDAVGTTNADFTTNLDGKVGLNTNAMMYGRADNNTLVPVKLDASTQDIQAIEHEHAEIHGGDHYNYCDYSLGVALNATIEFVLTTPNTTKWLHLVFDVFSSTGARIELYEGTSGVSGGTTITPRNNNRNSSNTSGVTLVKDPASITSDGTRAAGFLAGANRSGGFVQREKEYVLKQNEIYLLRITSLAASNNISWCAEWYEHTDKNTS